MTKTLNAALNMRWTIFFALMFGIALSPFDEGLLTSLYDWARPVVSMQGEIVARDQSSVTLRIWGKKTRECQFLAMQSFSITADGVRHDTRLERIDMDNQNRTRPAGIYDLGLWRIEPVNGASAVAIYIQHNCGGRMLLTRVAQVSL